MEIVIVLSLIVFHRIVQNIQVFCRLFIKQGRGADFQEGSVFIHLGKIVSGKLAFILNIRKLETLGEMNTLVVPFPLKTIGVSRK